MARLSPGLRQCVNFSLITAAAVATTARPIAARYVARPVFSPRRRSIMTAVDPMRRMTVASAITCPMTGSSQPSHPIVRNAVGSAAELKIGTESRSSARRSAKVKGRPTRAERPTASASACAMNVDSAVPTTIATPTQCSSSSRVRGIRAARIRTFPYMYALIRLAAFSTSSGALRVKSGRFSRVLSATGVTFRASHTDVGEEEFR